jgi:hypothetical protein
MEQSMEFLHKNFQWSVNGTLVRLWVMEDWLLCCTAFVAGSWVSNFCQNAMNCRKNKWLVAVALCLHFLAEDIIT